MRRTAKWMTVFLGVCFLVFSQGFAEVRYSSKNKGIIRSLDEVIQKQQREERVRSLPFVTVNVVNQPLGVVLAQVCEQSGFSFTIADGVNLNLPVTVSIVSEPLNQALEDILDQVGYWARIDEDASKITVIALVQKVFKIPPVLLGREEVKYVQGGTVQTSTKVETGEGESSANNGSQTELTSSLNAIIKESGRETGKTLMATVRGLLSRDGHATLDPTTGLLVVVDHSSYVRRIARVVKEWVRGFSYQVYIEAHIVEVLFKNAEEKGIDWSVVRHALMRTRNNRLSLSLAGATSAVLTNNPTIIIASKWNASENPAEAVLKALERQGKTRVVSQPHLLVMSHEVGFITAGDSVPYISRVERDYSGDNYMSISYDIARVNEGVTFAVVPHVEGDTVSLSFYPTYSTVKEWRKFVIGGDEVENPTVTIRQSHTKLVLHDGDFVVLGGAQSENLKDHTVKVPLLGDIPLIGWLFKGVSRDYTKGELVIMLRVRIVTNGLLSAFREEDGVSLE